MASTNTAIFNITFPVSSRTVRVRMFDTTTRMSVSSEYFVHPVRKGHETLNLCSVGFLIENPRLDRTIVYDLGCMKRFWRSPPPLAERMTRILAGLRVEKDASEVLRDAGVGLEAIDAVIWSHAHFDHTGDMTTFPAATKLVVGPGFRKAFLPAWPTNPESRLDELFLKDRELVEIDFGIAASESRNLDIGGFPAYDFFGDGSFYLLSAPGHLVGHVCGLARTTPDTFVFMGGDICHFPGLLRPTSSNPLPGKLPVPICACTFSDNLHSTERVPSGEATNGRVKNTPLYEISHSEHSAYVDRDQAVIDVEKAQKFDASPQALVCLAHDPTLLDVLPTLNRSPEQDINNWQAKGWKAQCRWRFLDELPRANGERGKEKIVKGIWRDGKVVDKV